MAKQGIDNVQIGHTIRAKVVKNKCAAPFRKAEFEIFYDGRKSDKVKELATVAISNDLIPRFDAKGNPSASGRTFKWANEPKFEAKSREDVVEQLRLFPTMQEELIDLLKNGIEDPSIAESVDNSDENLTDDEIENEAVEEVMKSAKKSKINDEAEEISEKSWDDI